MCGQVGIIFGHKRRRPDERDYLREVFIRMLLHSEERGPHASGLAWLKTDGSHRIFKRPMRAHELVYEKTFQELLGQVDNETTILMGHTRWRTRGNEFNNRNNHPIRAGIVIGTHNGTIYNANYLFRRWKLRRVAEVDSEILFRLAAKAARDGAMDIERFKARLRRCRRQITAVIACQTVPGTIFVLKGNRPLELRWHPRRQARPLRFGTRIPRRCARRGEGLEGTSGPAHEPDGVPARGPGRIFGGALRVHLPREEGGKTMTYTSINQAMNPTEPLKPNTNGMLRLFVYGTLKRGFWNHDRFCRGVLDIWEAEVRGRLYEMHSGIPALQVPDGDVLAHGTSDVWADVATQAGLSEQVAHTPYRPCKAPQRATGAACTGSFSPSTIPSRACPPSNAWRGSVRADRACTDGSSCRYVLPEWSSPHGVTSGIPVSNPTCVCDPFRHLGTGNPLTS